MSHAPRSATSLTAAPAPWRALPPGIWALGFGSLFTDISSEMIHSVLPIFMANVLGRSMLTIGIVEGVAEATAAVTKVFSGAFSDYFRKRKLPLVLGYALSAVTRPIFALADSIGWVFTARFIDRVGKGIRGAPRDALVADLAPPQLRGAAYGLRQALDSVGSLIGPLLAVALMAPFGSDTKVVMWAAIAPALIAVALLARFVREPERALAGAPSSRGIRLSDARALRSRYWLVVVIGAVFTLARFSEAFLVLRAQDVGLALRYVPVVMIVMNIVYAACAYPAGAAADRLRRRTLLLVGLALLIAADLALAMASSPVIVFAGAALWGAHMAFTQGLLAKLVADAAPANLRGTAFGVFNLVGGAALLLASLVAGALWSACGASATFFAGAGFASIAAIGLLAYSALSPARSSE